MGVPKPMHFAKSRIYKTGIMKKLDLKMVTELDEPEMMALNGGGFLRSVTGWALISSIIENWQDIRQGFSDGYAQQPPRH
jgi:hypothetical protein